MRTMEHSKQIHAHHTPVQGKIGSLVTRLARNAEEVQAAQRLRYRVFYEEMGAVKDEQTAHLKRDMDRFDDYCDHLLVLDQGEVVGTYRLLLDTRAEQAGGFYTQTEFNLDPILQTNKSARLLELGRSCILPSYRNKRTLELLWAGTWSYAVRNEVKLMFGCASFPTVDPNQISASLNWLNLNAGLSKNEDCNAQFNNGIKIANLKGKGTSHKQALLNMPPLLKAYLRVGAKFGSEAVIDHQFGTTDLLVVLKVADIAPRYLNYYGSDASRFAA